MASIDEDDWVAIRAGKGNTVHQFTPLTGEARMVTWEIESPGGHIVGFGHVLIKDHEHAEKYTNKNLYPPDVNRAALEYLKRATK